MSVTSHEPVGAAGLGPGAVERAHFPCLDAYRAIGMTAVFLAHAHYASIATDQGIFRPIFDRFDIGLPIFFVLSAFLLYRPFVVSQLAGRPAMATHRFYRHRIFRIFPAYWFALTVIVIWFGIKFDSLWQGVSFYALLQDYGSGPVFDPKFQPIYQAWSLATELAFYALLPLFAWAMRRSLRRFQLDAQVRLLLVVCGVLYAAGALFRLYLVAGDPTWGKNAVLWFPAWLDMFALGMALAVVSAWIGYTGHGPAIVDWAGRHPGMMWAISGLIFAGICVIGPNRTPLVVTKEYVLRQAVYGFCAVFFVLPGIFGDPYVGRIRAFLRHRTMAYLGAISLGFYLFHVAFLAKAEDWTGANPFHANFFAIVAIALPLTFLAANFSYYIVERPFLRLKGHPISTLWRRTPKRA